MLHDSCITISAKNISKFESSFPAIGFDGTSKRTFLKNLAFFIYVFLSIEKQKKPFLFYSTVLFYENFMLRDWTSVHPIMKHPPFGKLMPRSLKWIFKFEHYLFQRWKAQAEAWSFHFSLQNAEESNRFNRLHG